MAADVPQLQVSGSDLYDGSADIQDITHLNVKDPDEILQWAEHWEVSEVELRKAIAEVGTDVSDLRIILGKTTYGGGHLHKAGVEGGSGYTAAG